MIPRNRHARLALSAAGAAGLAGAGAARAVESTFVPTDPGTTYSWADPASWTSNPAVPNAIGDVANLNNPIVGAQTVGLNGSRTVGVVNLGSTANAITIAAGTPTTSALIFDNTTAPAVLTLGGTAANVISAPVTLADPLTINQTGAGTLTVAGPTGVIGGANGITLGGAGTGAVVLGATNTFTGGITINAGTLRGTTAGAFGAGAGAFTLAGGTLQLANDAATNFTRNVTVTGNATVVPDRSTAAATSTTHTLGALSIGGQTLTVTRGANITTTTVPPITAGVGGLTFGATTLTGTPTFAPGANTTLTLGALTQSGGTQGITVNGAGTLVLAGAGAFDGPASIVGGSVQLNNATALGTSATIALDRGGSAKRLLLAGGQTFAYNFDLGLTGTGTQVPGISGAGLLQQAGTGQARVNGTVTVGAGPSAGGTVSGSNTVGNELVLAGPVNAAAGYAGGFSQRDGRVVYAGGGSVTGTATVTGTMIAGATNGVPTGVNVNLGGSGNATLDLASQGAGGFDQTLAGLTLGNTGSAFSGTVALGARTLTLNGDLASITATTLSVSHAVNATAGGALVFAGTGRNVAVPDSTAADDLTVTGAAVGGAGAVTKTGAGTLVLRNVTASVPLAVSAGTVATSAPAVATAALTGTLTVPALSLADGTSARFNLSGGGSDLINGGAVTAAGTTTLNFAQFGGAIPAGTYPLITYAGASPGVGRFAIGTLPGRISALLTDTGSAIALAVSGNDTLRFTGAAGGTWDVANTVNFQLVDLNQPTAFFQSDEVVFDDSAATTTLAGTATVAPSRVTFNTAGTYTVPGTLVIGGVATLAKAGAGTLVLAGAANTYAGPTAIAGGTVVVAGAGSLGNGSATNTVALSGGGRVRFDSAAAAAVSLDLGANRSVAVGAGGGAFSYNNTTSAAGTATFTISGGLTGSAPLLLQTGGIAPAVYALSGANAGYAGAITVDAASTGVATLRIANQAAAPGGGSVTLNYPAAAASGTYGTLDLPGTALPATVALVMTSLQSGANSLRTQVTSTGTAALNGPVTVGGNSVVQLVSNGGTLTVNGTVAAAAAGYTGTFALRGSAAGVVNGPIRLPDAAFSKTDGATWTIASTGNAWLTTNVVSGGSLKLGANNALPTGAPVVIGQASDANASLLDLNGFGQEVGGLTYAAGNANSTRGVGNTAAATQSVLTINTVNGSDNFSFGVTTGGTGFTGGILSGNVRLAKNGAGTQALGGANTYAGTTTVNAGTLVVTGTHAGGGAYAVAGGTLAGTGTVTLLASATNQVLVQSGGTLSPGTGGTTTGILSLTDALPGTGAASTLTLAAGSTLRVDLNGLTAGTNYDRANVTGTVNVAGANLVTAVGYAAADQDRFVVVANDGADAVTGVFAFVNGVPLVGPDANGFYSAVTPAGPITVSYKADLAGVGSPLTGGNDIAVVVPEPAAAGLVAAAAAGLLAGRRRRHRRA